MEFRVLGPMRVVDSGASVDIGNAFQPRLMLAALLARPEQRVSADQLVDILWGDRPPPTGRRTVRSYAHRIRQWIGKDRLRTEHGGYAVIVGDGLDAARFRRLAEATPGGDLEQASAALCEALRLWRGPAFVEFADRQLIADEVVRLDELRATTMERWASMELVLGRHVGLSGALAEMIEQFPYRESLRALQMRALHRDGRQAEALAVYQQTRRLLVEQLGIEPGPGLQRVHEAILRGEDWPHDDPAQPAMAVSRSSRAEPRWSVPHELPAGVASFTGRADALAALDELLPDAARPTGPMALAAITGTAGIGKTALAVHWGHRVADRFPDGQLYLDLRGYSDAPPLRAIEALSVLLSGLGLSPDEIPASAAAAAARYRSSLASRQVLVVLDNAASAEQVRPLLPGSPTCVVLVTSRDRLSGLAAREGARRHLLDALSVREAVELLERIVGAQRVSAEPDQVGELVKLCGGLPLALRITAARLAEQPDHKVGTYLEELLATGDAVTAMAVAGGDVAVRSAFDLSYRRLSEPARRTFRRLGIVPCPDFSLAAAAALAGLPEREASAALDELTAAHLLIRGPGGRFSLHDLLRRYAASLTEVEDGESERGAARIRFYEWMVVMCLGAADLTSPEMVRLPKPADVPGPGSALTDDAAALAWLDAERANLVAAIRDAVRDGPQRAAWLCADALRGYFDQRRFAIDWLSVARAGLAAARSDGDPVARAGAFHGLAHAHCSLGHAPRAIAYLRRTITLAACSGWHAGEAAASNNLGILLQQQGKTDESMESLRRALDIHHRAGRHLGQAAATASLANLYRERGLLLEGAQLAESARVLYRIHGSRRTHALADTSLAELYRLLGRFNEAGRLLLAAVALHRELGRRRTEASVWVTLARLYHDIEEIDEANRAARTARAIADDLQEPLLQVDAGNALGLALSAKENHQAAAEIHRDALGMAESVGLQYGAAEALLGLAAARAGGCNPAAAQHDAQRALDLAREARFAVLEGRALTMLAGLHYAEDGTEPALGLARTALRAHEDTGHRIGAAQTHVLLTLIHDDLGDAALAARHGKSAKDLYTALGVPAPRGAH